MGRIYDGAAAYTGTPSLLYDDANRLIEARDPANGFATLATYSYDAFGRRVAKTTPTQSFVYLYDTQGHLIEEIEKKAATDHARAYVFLEDELVGTIDQEVEVGTAALWGALSLRSLDPKAPIFPLLILVLSGGALLLLAKRQPAVATATTGAMLAVFTCAGTTRPPPTFAWVHTDPLGTPLAVTSAPPVASDVRVLWRASYEPFGKATVDEDPDGDSATFTLNVRFPGQYADAETGWHSNGFRTYDPFAGRYLEADPIGLAGGLNLYGYGASNPLGVVDPLGLDGVALNGLPVVSRMTVDAISAGFFLGHYVWGHGEPVDLGAIGLGATFENSASVGAQVAVFNALAAVRARQAAKQACTDCDDRRSLSFAIPETSLPGGTQVRFEPGLFSVGRSSFFASADCSLSVDCSSGSYSYSCSSEFKIRDRFTDPFDQEDRQRGKPGWDPPGTTPFPINHMFSREASGSGHI